MRDGGRTERALSIAANAQNGTVGFECVCEVPAEITVHQASTLLRRNYVRIPHDNNKDDSNTNDLSGSL